MINDYSVHHLTCVVYKYSQIKFFLFILEKLPFFWECANYGKVTPWASSLQKYSGQHFIPVCWWRQIILNYRYIIVIPMHQHIYISRSFDVNYPWMHTLHYQHSFGCRPTFYLLGAFKQPYLQSMSTFNIISPDELSLEIHATHFHWTLNVWQCRGV